MTWRNPGDGKVAVTCSNCGKSLGLAKPGSCKRCPRCGGTGCA